MKEGGSEKRREREIEGGGGEGKESERSSFYPSIF